MARSSVWKVLVPVAIALSTFAYGCCQLSFEAQCCVSHPELHPEFCGADDDTNSSHDLPESCAETPQAAVTIMEEYCTSCHGDDGSSAGGFYYARDFNRMVATGKVDVEEPEASRILSRMRGETMPPSDCAECPRPSESEIQTLEMWVDCLASGEVDADDNPGADPDREFITREEMHAFMVEDLLSSEVSGLDRPYIRYVSLVHLYNAGISLDSLETYRFGLSKLLNSLSWAPDIANPVPVDPNRVVLRIDIRDYAWQTGHAKRGDDPVDGWEHLLKAYPYALSFDDAYFNTLVAETQSRFPYLGADWIVGAAAVPPLYHELLVVPDTQAAFLDKFGVDQDANVEQHWVQGAGFTGTESLPSKNNRIIERHPADGDYCWVSYDFAFEGDESKDIFLSPLDFEADGGELFCSLPNGLQAYMLADAAGNILEKGPLDVVSDPERGDDNYLVVNGLSCMRCHAEGILPKEDQVRAYVQDNESDFTNDELDTIYEIYVPKEEMFSLQEGDRESFLDICDETGTPRGGKEPIWALNIAFEQVIELERAAAEVGLTSEEFLELLPNMPEEFDVLKQLATEEIRTIKRDQFLIVAADLTCYVETGHMDCRDSTWGCGVSQLPCLSGQTCNSNGACIED